MLSNREIAALILAAVFVAAILFIPGVRKSILEMLGLVFSRQLLPIFGSYLVYASVVLLVFHWLKLWQFDLLKDSIAVVLFVGFPLLFKAGSAKSGVSLIRDTFVETVSVAAVVVFYLNLVSLPIWAELTLQLVILFTAVMAVFAATDEQYRPVARLMNGALGVIFIGLIVFTTVVLVRTWDQQDFGQVGRSLLISIWYPFALLPFIYFVSFFSQAQLVMVMLPYFNNQRPLPFRVRLAVLLGFRGSTRYAASFTGNWRSRVGQLEQFSEARFLMSEYRASLISQK